MPKRGGSRGQKKPTLRELTRSWLADGEIDTWVQELHRGSDRAAALVAVATLDHELAELIQTRFRRLSESEVNALFYERRAPLSTLSERILIADALGLISADEKNALEIMRRVRNSFAHSISPLTFSNHLIAKECAKLSVPERYLATTPRDRFVVATLFLTRRFTKTALEIHGARTTFMERELNRMKDQAPHAQDASPDTDDTGNTRDPQNRR